MKKVLLFLFLFSISNYAQNTDGDAFLDYKDLDDDNDGISDCNESSDYVLSKFFWTLNLPAGNLEMDEVYNTKITDWVLSSTTSLIFNTGIYSVAGKNIAITGMTSTSFAEALTNGDYIEMSFTTSSEVSSMTLRNVASGWYLPYKGDSFYSSTKYSETSTGVWSTLSTDVFHTDNGATYALFDNMTVADIKLKPNTQYSFRFYTYGQIDDSADGFSIIDDFTFFVDACRAQDSDGDGINDHLDSDSDNDGCPDALEGDALNSQIGYDELDSDYRITGGEDVDGVPTLASGGQGVGSSIDGDNQADECSLCDINNPDYLDSDNDGYRDFCDLDDDNDGILDIIECQNMSPMQFLGLSSTAQSYSVLSTTITQVANTSGKVDAANTDNDGNLAFGKTDTSVDITASNPSSFIISPATNGDRDFDGVDRWTITSPGIIFRVNDPTNGLNIVSNSIGSISFMANDGNPKGWTIEAYAISNLTIIMNKGNGFSDINVSVIVPCPDFDNDGITNDLDIDSDNDGCPDALEGDALNSQIGYDELDSDYRITGGEDVDGVPTLASGGQGVGSSIDDANQADECSPCDINNPDYLDSDKDGYGDFCDLDDDNDGIVDGVEGVTTCNSDIVWEGTDIASSAVLTLPHTGAIAGSVSGDGASSDWGSVAINSVIVNSRTGAFGVNFVNAFDGITTYHSTAGSNAGEELELEINLASPLALTIQLNGAGITRNTEFTFSVPAGAITVNDPDNQLHYVVSSFGNSVTFKAVASFMAYTNATWSIYLPKASVITFKREEIITSGNPAFTRFGFSTIVNCGIDTDTDGLPDHLDLDSDADGCPDAIEGGENFTIDDLVSNSDFDGGSTDVKYNLGTGIDTDNDGLLDVVETVDNVGQALGGSKDDTVNSCPLAIDFDGTDDVIKAGNSFNISGYSELTLQFWVKPGLASQTYAGIVGQKGVLEIAQNGANLECSIYNGGSVSSTSYVLDATKWQHITLVYNKGDAKLYINGKNQFDGTLGGASLDSNTETFNVGGEIKTGATSNYFNGWIDEVRVFNVVLTDDQILQTVHQEIEESTHNKVQGVIIPKAIQDRPTGNKIDWSNLKLYYKMGTSFNNRKTIDYSDDVNDGALFNIYTQQTETAPMPFVTDSDGDWETNTTWLHSDVWTLPEYTDTNTPAIVKIKNEVEVSDSYSTLGLIIDNGEKLTVNGDNQVLNTYYLELNGTLDLMSDSQLIQTKNSDLVTSSSGKVKRRQEGESNVFRYNYWSSPVGETALKSLIDENTTSNNLNNTSFSLNMLRDSAGDLVNYTSTYNLDGFISNYWLYTYINGVNYWYWKSFNESTLLAPGLGYTQKGGGSLSEYIFEGKPNNGTILLSVSDIGGAGSEVGVSRTLSLVGNPYPSAIDAHQFISDNSSVISGSIYLWEHWAGNTHVLNDYQGGYATLNSMDKVRAYQFIGLDGYSTTYQGGTKTPTQYIPVAQSFMVEVTTPTGNIIFNNGQRFFKKEANGESVFFKDGSVSKEKNTEETQEATSEVLQKIKLEFLTSNGLGREMVLGFSNLTTDGHDYGYDATAYETFDNDLTMSLNNLPLVMQGFSNITLDKVIDFNFQSDGTVTFSIAATSFVDFPESQDVYLLDTESGTYHNLKTGGIYNFTSEVGTFNDRFKIVFQKDSSLSTEASTYSESNMYFQNKSNTFYAKNLSNNVIKLSLISMHGQVVFEIGDVSKIQLENGIQFTNIATGTYVVNIQTNANVVLTKKIIVK